MIAVSQCFMGGWLRDRRMQKTGEFYRRPPTAPRDFSPIVNKLFLTISVLVAVFPLPQQRERLGVAVDSPAGMMRYCNAD